MVVNFKARDINRSTRRLTRTLTLIIYIYIYIYIYISCFLFSEFMIRSFRLILSNRTRIKRKLKILWYFFSY
jgi:hypothetical protein